MMGRWQQRVGVGTSLRLDADALAQAACLGARVKVGGGQQCLLCMVHIVGGAGQSCGEGSGAALLAALGLLLLARAGCWGLCVGGGCCYYVVGILTVLVPARWCQKRRDPTINMRWKGCVCVCVFLASGSEVGSCKA
jgi:hypothetical protein